MSIILKNVANISQAKLISRALSTTPAVWLKSWRTERGLPSNRTSEGILTDGSDFTYLDGRPTPLLHRQKKRILRQRELASKIVEMFSELEFAKERHHNMEEAKEQERQNILANRLKPKGVTLYKKK